MNKHFLQHKILLKLGYEPTFSQEKAILELANFFDDVDNLCIFVLLGYAGTGKTYLISALIKFLDEIKLKVVLLAPTGRAAKVLTSYSEHNASTIHKCIYRKKSTESINDNFVLNYNKYKDTVFIVDEASMIGNSDSANSIFGNG
ncbi:MAG: AAA family ATPase, partial [Bacteroidales bacterium]|nr:AAA family ATPase [Bacteroidales bacterium]